MREVNHFLLVLTKSGIFWFGHVQGTFQQAYIMKDFKDQIHVPLLLLTLTLEMNSEGL